MSFSNFLILCLVLVQPRKCPEMTENMLSGMLSISTNKINLPSSFEALCCVGSAAAQWWIIYVISVLFCYAFMHVCLLMPFGHLLGKG